MTLKNIKFPTTKKEFQKKKKNSHLHILKTKHKNMDKKNKYIKQKINHKNVKKEKQH